MKKLFGLLFIIMLLGLTGCELTNGSGAASSSEKTESGKSNASSSKVDKAEASSSKVENTSSSKNENTSSSEVEKKEPDTEVKEKENSSSEKKRPEDVTTGEMPIVTGERYDAFYISISPQEFKALGFELGDGVNVALSNGTVYEDIPFYSGDYCRLYEYYVYENIYDDTIDVCCNYYPEFYVAEDLSDDMTATITISKKGKYKDIENRMNWDYSNKVEDFPNEEVFANFRELSGGNIVPGRFYRGASPCNNNRNRSPYVNGLMRNHNIAYVLDLADSRKDFENYREQYGDIYSYDWDLFLNDKMYFVEMDFDFTCDEYREWIAEGLIDLIKHDGPYYIHCNEGKDRTGFVCVILEGLAGATYEEMRDDYMETYKNYYGIDDKNDPETYDLIVETYFDNFMMLLHGEDDHRSLKTSTYEEDIEDYLFEGGMSEKQIKKLKKLLTKKD